MCDAWCEVKQETWMCDQVTSPTLHLTSNIWRSDSFRDSSNNSSAITTSRFQLQKRIMEFTANIWSLVDRRSMSLNRWEDAETETGPLVVGSVVFSTVWSAVNLYDLQTLTYMLLLLFFGERLHFVETWLINEKTIKHDLDQEILDASSSKKWENNKQTRCL